MNGISYRGRSRCSSRASAAGTGTQMKWRVPRRCQEAAREPTRRVGRCRCPRAWVLAGSGTPLGAAPLQGSAGAAAATHGQPLAARLYSILPHSGRPFSPKTQPQIVWRLKGWGKTRARTALCEWNSRVQDSFSGVSRRSVGLKSGTRLGAPLLAPVACWRPMKSVGVAPESWLRPTKAGLFMMTLECEECLAQGR